jgi:hypothetical protein
VGLPPIYKFLILKDLSVKKCRAVQGFGTPKWCAVVGYRNSLSTSSQPYLRLPQVERIDHGLVQPRNKQTPFPWMSTLLWSTKSGHWFRFIRPLIRLPLAFCIRCSCVAVDGCSSPSGSAAHPPQPDPGWYSLILASTPFSGF